MKKLLSVFLLCSILSLIPVQAQNVEIKQQEENSKKEIRIEVPVWEDYVPKKYVNPRTDFRKGSIIAEMTLGILLTDLILTAPIGIPMICHSATKIKHAKYAEKKEKFENGLKTAELIDNQFQKQEYYNKLIKDCKLKKQKKAKVQKTKSEEN